MHNDVATTEQIKKLEADWIASCNNQWGQVLMELAGQQAAKIAYKLWHSRQGQVIVVCGGGNNGGDGFVIARYLHMRNVPVKVYLISNKESSVEDQKMATTEANTNKNIAKNLGIDIEIVRRLPQLKLEDAKLIIDAIFGTGLDRTVAGLYKDVIEKINEIRLSRELLVLAVDIPSGVNTDDGQIMGTAIKADVTTTFGYIKAGLLCHPAADLCGQLHLIDIGLPLLNKREPEIKLTTVEYVASLLPERKADSNKGTFGTLLTVAGSEGMSGAAFLSSRSSLRAGAGLVFLATAHSVLEHLPPGEVIYKPLPETDKQSIDSKAVGDVFELLKTATALVFGPGLTTHPKTVDFVKEFLQAFIKEKDPIPCLLDADALNALSQSPEILDSKPKLMVLTPHPKELSRLTGQWTTQIQSDRIGAALGAAIKFGAVLVLKGAHSVVASPDGRVFVNPTGNASMAKAGAGDVLSGVIGGLLAQKLPPFEAAVAGTYIHGLAGEIASVELGMTIVLANDISMNISTAIEQIKKKKASAFEKIVFKWTDAS